MPEGTLDAATEKTEEAAVAEAELGTAAEADSLLACGTAELLAGVGTAEAPASLAALLDNTAGTLEDADAPADTAGAAEDWLSGTADATDDTEPCDNERVGEATAGGSLLPTDPLGTAALTKLEEGTAAADDTKDDWADEDIALGNTDEVAGGRGATGATGGAGAGHGWAEQQHRQS